MVTNHHNPHLSPKDSTIIMPRVEGIYNDVDIDEVKPKFYDREDVIETSSGNRIWRSSVLCGSDRLVVEGCSVIESEALLRGDLAPIHVGRHCRISEKSSLRPPLINGKFVQQTIQDFCVIEANAIVRAALVNHCTYVWRRICYSLRLQSALTVCVCVCVCQSYRCRISNRRALCPRPMLSSLTRLCCAA